MSVAPEPWPENRDIEGHPRLWRRHGTGYGWRVAIRGRRLDIHFLLTELAEEGFSEEAVRDYADDRGLDVADVGAAIRYYQENREEIEEYISFWGWQNEQLRESWRIESEDQMLFALRSKEREAREIERARQRLLLALEALDADCVQQASVPQSPRLIGSLTPEAARQALADYSARVEPEYDGLLWDAVMELFNEGDEESEERVLVERAAEELRRRLESRGPQAVSKSASTARSGPDELQSV